MLVFQGLRKDRPSPLINDWPEEFHTKVEQVSQFDRHFFIHSHSCFPEHNTDSEPLFLLLPDFIEGRPPFFLLGLSVPCWLYFSRLLVFFTDPWSGAPLIGFSHFWKVVSLIPLGKPTFLSEFAHLFPTLNANSFFFFLIRKKYILAYQTWSCSPILKFLLCLIIVFMDYQ